MATKMNFEALLSAILRNAQHAAHKPFIVGIAGVPAAGKTTLSQQLETALAKRGLNACALQMDGFHHYNDKLDSLSLRAVKGRIDTFDAARFSKFLQRLRSGEGGFWWPIYSRELHDPIERGRWVPAQLDIALVEGNYLFVAEGTWESLSSSFDYRIFIDLDDSIISQRLYERQIAGGKSQEDAREKVEGTDLPNAHFIRDKSKGPFVRFVSDL